MGRMPARILADLSLRLLARAIALALDIDDEMDAVSGPSFSATSALPIAWAQSGLTAAHTRWFECAYALFDHGAVLRREPELVQLLGAR